MAKTPARSAEQPDGPALRPLERILAGMFVGIIVLTVIAFLVLMAGSAGGWLGEQLYALLLGVTMFGLPVAIVLMLVLTIMLAVRRARANRDR